MKDANWKYAERSILLDRKNSRYYDFFPIYKIPTINVSLEEKDILGDSTIYGISISVPDYSDKKPEAVWYLRLTDEDMKQIIAQYTQLNLMKKSK